MPEPHEQLDKAMNARRLELHMRWGDVSTGAGITYEALRAIRRGESRPTELTARAIDEALRWVSGSVYAILAGGQPTPLESVSPAVELTFPAREALRRMVRASARELGMTPDDVDEAVRLARQDLAQDGPTLAPPTGDVAPQGYGRDLSELVRARRLGVGMSLQDVAATAVDPDSGRHTVEAEWLARLERAELDPDETPQYPQLDALVGALHLDPEEVQRAAARQFKGVEISWSEDDQVQGLGPGPVNAEGQAKLDKLMNAYRPAPRDGRK